MARGFRDEDRASDNQQPVTFEGVRCIRTTPDACLCVVDGVERWVPQSLIHDDSEVYRKGDEGKLVIAAWFAAKEWGYHE